MNSQSMMWLCSLLVITLMSLQGFVRTPIRWWWDALIRIAFIVFVCVAGMIVKSIEWYAVFLGWGFVLFCFSCQKRYEKQQQMALLALDADGLRNSYKNIEWLNWGLNGSLYRDLNEALALYVEQRPEEAEKVLARWDNFPGMPSQLRYLPEAYRTTGDHILLHWQKLIDEYESLRKERVAAPQMVAAAEPGLNVTGTISSSAESRQTGTELNLADAAASSTYAAGDEPAKSIGTPLEADKELLPDKRIPLTESRAALASASNVSDEAHKNEVDATNAPIVADNNLRKVRTQMMLLHVARAYAEQNRLDEAAKCLTDFKVANQTGLSQQQLALTFLPFFALSGDTGKTELLLEVARRSSPMDYILMQTNYCKEHAKYWLARCARAAGDEAKAQELFREALTLSSSDLFRTRINLQLSREPQKAGDTNGGAERIWKDLKRAEFVQNVFRPITMPLAIGLILLCMFAAFPLTELYAFLKEPPRLLTSLLHIIDQLGNGSITRLLEQSKFGYGDFLQMAGILKLQVLGNFALIPPLVFLKGEVWRLVTFLFLHGNVTHLLFNVLGLFFFGRMAAGIFGTPKFLFIFFAGGILSGVYASWMRFSEPVIGASGAIFAIFGAFGAATYRLKDRIPELVWKRQMGILLVLALAQVVLDHSSFIKGISGAAHLGGLIAGIAIGLVMPLNIPKEIGANAKDDVRTTDGIAPHADAEVRRGTAALQADADVLGDGTKSRKEDGVRGDKALQSDADFPRDGISPQSDAEVLSDDTAPQLDAEVPRGGAAPKPDAGAPDDAACDGVGEAPRDELG